MTRIPVEPAATTGRAGDQQDHTPHRPLVDERTLRRIVGASGIAAMVWLGTWSPAAVVIAGLAGLAVLAVNYLREQ